MATAILGVALILAIFFVWFFTHQSKEKERLLLIEKGVDLSDLPERKKFTFRIPWLKLGCIVIAIAIGLVAASMFEDAGGAGSNEMIPVAVFLFFGGLGLIAAHFIGKNSAKKNEK